MPRVTVFNLAKSDPLLDIEHAVTDALVSMPQLAISSDEVDLVPAFVPEAFLGAVVRIDVDVWERPERTKDALQQLAARVARAFQGVVGTDRRVKVVVRPYDIGRSGWVSV